LEVTEGMKEKKAYCQQMYTG